ncbi:MAG: ABC transporter ATP-binding protein [Sarcina sp.]
MLELKNISFSYGKKQILKNVEFSANKGEFVSIIGPNGSGKTTLLKCINKINNPSEGEIIIDGEDVLKIRLEKIAKKVAYVPQMLNESYEVNVTDIIMLGRKPYITWSVRDEDMDIVTNIMNEMDILHLADKNFSELSGGQKQKVLIARALVQETPVYILDEPISFLDIKNQLEVLGKAKRFAKDGGKTVVVVLHDLNMAMAYSDKILLMKSGEKISYGTPKEVLTKENIKNVYGIDVEIYNNNIIPKIEY